MREYYITKNDSGQRLNKFLEKAVPLLSGGMMHKYLRLKRIKVQRADILSMDKALDKVNTVHSVLLKGDMAKAVYRELKRYEQFLNA